MATIEQKTAQAILQQTEEVIVGGVTYQVSPPSTATLILASEAISLLPSRKMDSEDVLNESLAVARDCRVIGDIIAILILGAKNLTETSEGKRFGWRSLWGGLIHRGRTEDDRKAELSKRLLEDLTPKELNELCARLLSKMQIGDFFGLTSFLQEINLLRPTKEVSETTASGR